MTEARQRDLNRSMSLTDPNLHIDVTEGTVETKLPNSTRVIHANVSEGAVLNLKMDCSGVLPVQLVSNFTGSGKVTLNGLTISGGASWTAHVINGFEVSESARSNALDFQDGVIITTAPDDDIHNVFLDGPAGLVVVINLFNESSVWPEGKAINIYLSQSLSMVGKTFLVGNVVETSGDTHAPVTKVVYTTLGGTVTDTIPENKVALYYCAGFDNLFTNTMVYLKLGLGGDITALQAQADDFESRIYALEHPE